jgi:hypothetical protein
MLRNISFSFLLISHVLLLGQNTTVSTPTKIPASIDKVKLVGKNADGYVVRLSGNEEIFQAYSNDLRLTVAKKFEFNKNEGFIQYVHLLKSGMIIYFLRAESNYTTLVAQIIDNKLQKVGTTSVIDTLYESIELANANLRSYSDPSKKYILFYIPFFTNKQVIYMQMTISDYNLNIVSKSKIEIGRNEREMVYAKAFLDTAGNAVLVLNGSNTTFEFHTINKENGTSKVNRINFGKQLFGDPYFEIDNKNGGLVFAGFYDNKEGTGEAAAYGVFYQKYSLETGKPIASNIVSMPDSFMRKLTGREASITNNRLFTFNIKKITQRIDGGVAVIAESFIRDTRQEQSISLSIINPYNNFRTINTFQYNDIIAFSMNADGVMEWNTILRKRQYSEEDNGYFSSFLTVNTKDKLFFLYSDDETQSSDLDIYELNSNGIAYKKLIATKQEKDLRYIPKLGKQTALNEALLPSIRKGIFHLVRFKF